jgi:hypothetical protein
MNAKLLGFAYDLSGFAKDYLHNPHTTAFRRDRGRPARTERSEQRQRLSLAQCTSHLAVLEAGGTPQSQSQGLRVWLQRVGRSREGCSLRSVRAGRPRSQ